METDDIKTESNSNEDILNFRDQLLVREVLSCGIGKEDKLLHLGAGFSDNLIFNYLVDLNTQGLISDLNLEYYAVDVNSEKLTELIKLNSETGDKFKLHTYNQSVQGFLGTVTEEYHWTLITGIFNEKLYGDKQIEFLDGVLSEALKYSTEGVIFNINLTDKLDDSYTIKHIISYIDSVYDRYKISRINEFDYIFCVNKYFHSITN